MIAVIQLVRNAEVHVNKQLIGQISRGILALIGMEKSDSISTGKKLVDRILSYRIFPDEQGKMNLSLKDINGGLLMVPQFTLVAETNKGTRPGFSIGMDHAAGQSLFLDTLAYAKEIYKTVASGEFGASMQVSLCNDGPVTFILSSK